MYKTDGELLLSEYLNRAGLPFDYEQGEVGKSTQPDFCVRFEGARIRLEVKDVQESLRDYQNWWTMSRQQRLNRIRNRFNAARAQCREYAEECCCAVLSASNKPPCPAESVSNQAAQDLRDACGLTDPLTIVQALFGDPNVNLLSGDWCFRGGKPRLFNFERQEPQYQYISAVVVIDQLDLISRAAMVELRHRQGVLGREFSLDELKAIANEVCATRETWSPITRLIVYENPYASMPLPRRIFTAPWDERWGVLANSGGTGIGRIFAGEKLSAWEASVSGTEETA